MHNYGGWIGTESTEADADEKKNDRNKLLRIIN